MKEQFKAVLFLFFESVFHSIIQKNIYFLEKSLAISKKIIILMTGGRNKTSQNELYILQHKQMTIYADTYKSRNFKKLVKDFILNKIEYNEIDTEIRNRFESVMRFRTSFTDEQKKAIFNRRFGRVEEFIKEGIKDYYYEHKDEDENLFQILVDDAQNKFNEEYRSFYNKYQR